MARIRIGEDRWLSESDTSIEDTSGQRIDVRLLDSERSFFHILDRDGKAALSDLETELEKPSPEALKRWMDRLLTKYPQSFKIEQGLVSLCWGVPDPGFDLFDIAKNLTAGGKVLLVLGTASRHIERDQPGAGGPAYSGDAMYLPEIAVALALRTSRDPLEIRTSFDIDVDENVSTRWRDWNIVSTGMGNVNSVTRKVVAQAPKGIRPWPQFSTGSSILPASRKPDGSFFPPYTGDSTQQNVGMLGAIPSPWNPQRTVVCAAGVGANGTVAALRTLLALVRQKTQGDQTILRLLGGRSAYNHPMSRQASRVVRGKFRTYSNITPPGVYMVQGLEEDDPIEVVE